MGWRRQRGQGDRPASGDTVQAEAAGSTLGPVGGRGLEEKGHQHNHRHVMNTSELTLRKGSHGKFYVTCCLSEQKKF